MTAFSLARRPGRTARPGRTGRSGHIAALPALGALLAATALAGCGAGRHNETYSEVAAIDGASATYGPVQIRDAEVDGPIGVGGNGFLEFSLHSATAPTTPDTLLSITSDANPTGGPLQLFDVTGTTAAPVTSVLTPALVPGPSRFAALIVNVPGGLMPSSYVNITFTFRNEGVHVLQVPVRRTVTGAQTSQLVVATPGTSPTVDASLAP